MRDEVLVFPFPAIVGQDKMKEALILNVINPTLSGVLIRGEKGTAKSTAVRALANLLPEIEVVDGCPFNCDPNNPDEMCVECRKKYEKGEKLPVKKRKIKVVELPVSATEDRVVGTLDLETALKEGEKKFEPGILAEANRNILYVDEVNLLEDHIVDVLLDSAAMGINTVEREGISYTHPARFILVGTMNPEEGELRPQLLDRFGLCVNITGLKDLKDRIEVVRRRAEFDENPKKFIEKWKSEMDKLRERIIKAKELLPKVSISEEMLKKIIELSLKVGVDGHRSDLIMMKAAKTYAAYRGRIEVLPEDIKDAAELALPHRVRRKPFQELFLDKKLIEEHLGG